MRENWWDSCAEDREEAHAARERDVLTFAQETRPRIGCESSLFHVLEEEDRQAVVKGLADRDRKRWLYPESRVSMETRGLYVELKSSELLRKLC